MKRVLWINPHDLCVETCDSRLQKVFVEKKSIHSLLEFFLEIPDGQQLSTGTVVGFEHGGSVDFEIIDGTRYHPRVDTLLIPVKVEMFECSDGEFVNWVRKHWVAKFPEQ